MLDYIEAAVLDGKMDGKMVPLARVVAALRDLGYPEEDVRKVVTATEPRPITLTEASEKYGIPRGTLLRWVHFGLLKVIARRKGPGPGGLVIVDEHELQYRIEHPPKPGRPPRNGRK